MLTIVSTYLLRAIALAGTLGVLIKRIMAAPAPEPRHEYSLYVFACVLVATLLTLLVAFPKACRAILRHPDLLVPIGLYVTAQELLGLIFFKEVAINLTQPFPNIVSQLHLLLPLLALAAILAGWQTRLALQVTTGNEVNLLEGLRDLPRWFPRTLAVSLLGTGCLYLALTLSLFLRVEFSAPLLALMAFATISWNLATFAVLPVVLASPEPLFRAISLGFKVSKLHRCRFFLPVSLQLIIIGFVSFASVNYITAAQKFGESRDSIHVKQKANYKINAIWTGDFYSKNHWHSTYMDAVEVKDALPNSFRLSLLMLVLSLALMLRICAAIVPNDTHGPTPSPGRNYYLVLLPLAALLLFPFELSAFAASLLRDKTTSSETKLGEPRVIKAWNEVNKHRFFQADEGLHGINDIAVGDLDGKPGEDVIVAGGKQAVTLDPQGYVKQTISFQQSPRSEESTSGDYFSDVKIIDLEQDGKCEFWASGYEQPFTVLDNSGKRIKTFQKPEKSSVITALAAGDVNGDGASELLASSGENLSLYNMRDGLLWSKRISRISTSDVSMFDTNGDSLPEILMESTRETLVMDKNGEKLKTIKMPSPPTGWLLEQDERPLSVFMAENQLGLFTLDGALKAKYPAPLSDIPDNRHFGEDEQVSKILAQVTPYRAQTVRVRLVASQPKHLAVVASLGGETRRNTMLYIYNAQGEILYQELFETNSPFLRVLPAETPEGPESLLVAAEDSIWRFGRQ